MGTVGRLSATNAGVVELGSGDDASRFFQVTAVRGSVLPRRRLAMQARGHEDEAHAREVG